MKSTTRRSNPEHRAETFRSPWAIDSFEQGDGSAGIDAIHHVSRDIVIGVTQTVALQAGDVLLVTEDTETFQGSDLASITVGNDDVFVFRPDTVGDYSAGSFFVLLDSPLGEKISGLTLVEKDTTVGDTFVRAGATSY